MGDNSILNNLVLISLFIFDLDVELESLKCRSLGGVVCSTKYFLHDLEFESRVARAVYSVGSSFTTLAGPAPSVPFSPVTPTMLQVPMPLNSSAFTLPPSSVA